jgi:hypothetical protein
VGDTYIGGAVPMRLMGKGKEAAVQETFYTTKKEER